LHGRGEVRDSIAGFHFGWNVRGVWAGLVVAEVAMAIFMCARLFRRGMKPPYPQSA